MAGVLNMPIRSSTVVVLQQIEDLILQEFEW